MRKGIVLFVLAMGFMAAMDAMARDLVLVGPDGEGGRWELVDLGSGRDPLDMRRMPLQSGAVGVDLDPSSAHSPSLSLYGDRLVVYDRADAERATAGDELRVYRVAADLSLRLERTIPVFGGAGQAAILAADDFPQTEVLFFPSRIWVIATIGRDWRGFVANAWKVDAAGSLEPLPETAYGAARPASNGSDWGRCILIPQILRAYRGDETLLGKPYEALRAFMTESPATSASSYVVKPKDRCLAVFRDHQDPGRIVDLRTGAYRPFPRRGGDSYEAPILPLTDSYFDLSRAVLSEVGDKACLVYCDSTFISVYDMDYPLYPRRLALIPHGMEDVRSWRIAGAFKGGFLLRDRSAGLVPYTIGAGGSCRPFWDPKALLAEAIARGDAERALKLCAWGVDPRAAGDDGRALWLGAILVDAPALLDALIAYMEKTYPETLDAGTSAFLVRDAPLGYAVAKGRTARALALAKRVKPADFAAGPDAQVLFMAAERGDTALCGALIDTGIPTTTVFRSGASYGNALAYAKDAATRTYLVWRGVPETITLAEPQDIYGADEGLVLRASPSSQAAVVARGGVDFTTRMFSLLASRAVIEYIDGRMCRWIKVRPQGGGVEGWAPSSRFTHSYDDGE